MLVNKNAIVELVTNTEICGKEYFRIEFREPCIYCNYIDDSGNCVICGGTGWVRGTAYEPVGEPSSEDEN